MWRLSSWSILLVQPSTSLLGSLLSGVVAPDRALSMGQSSVEVSVKVPFIGQIDLLKKDSYSIGL